MPGKFAFLIYANRTKKIWEIEAYRASKACSKARIPKVCNKRFPPCGPVVSHI